MYTLEEYLDERRRSAYGMWLNSLDPDTAARITVATFPMAQGLLGQIVEVSPMNSRALLITDATHSIPVQVNRNGVRAIAEGIGVLGFLEIHHVSATTDIEEGDLLVTSGLGGRFPVGYPVAVVSEVERDPGQAFARVLARPSAALDRTRHLLLVFTAQSAEGE